MLSDAQPASPFVPQQFAENEAEARAAAANKTAVEAKSEIPPVPDAPVPPPSEELRARFATPPQPQSDRTVAPNELAPNAAGCSEPFQDPVVLSGPAGATMECEPSAQNPAESDGPSGGTREAARETVTLFADGPSEPASACGEGQNAVEPPVTAEAGIGFLRWVEQPPDLPRHAQNPPEFQMAAEETPDMDNQHNKSANVEQTAKKKILVIDDDPTLRMLLQMGLKPHGFDCVTAENGMAAKQLFQTTHPDLVLVDLLMPVMDGLAFIQWLREAAQDSTPVLVFTNMEDPKITEEALRSGANSFAHKPLHLNDLLDAIRKLVPA